MFWDWKEPLLLGMLILTPSCLFHQVSLNSETPVPGIPTSVRWSFWSGPKYLRPYSALDFWMWSRLHASWQHVSMSPKSACLSTMASMPQSYHTIPYHTIPYHTIPYHTISTIPYRTIPYRTVPYRTIPYHTVPYHTIPYPYHIHTIPYHTIPFPTNGILSQ